MEREKDKGQCQPKGGRKEVHHEGARKRFLFPFTIRGGAGMSSQKKT
jgi:hypothetical protein